MLCAGFLYSYFGVITHQLWLIYFGYGVIGGIGLGLGYISPVSTLIKWFPDRPGLATGMAIMGFGGGAMIGSPLAIKLMAHFHTTRMGVGKTFLVMGTFYFCFMMFGVFTIRVPREGWKPEGWTPRVKPQAMITTHNVEVNTAFRTPQFWLLVDRAVHQRHRGHRHSRTGLAHDSGAVQGSIGPVAAGGFVGLLSLFNMAGRFFWSSASDYHRPENHLLHIFHVGRGALLLLPQTGADHLNSVALFVGISVVLLSMYGGGFATIPAYLRDLFGTHHVSAIHGRLLTAWSVAGVLGPVLVNYMREYQIAHGVDKASAYQTVLQIMAGLLVVGFVANLLVRPVARKVLATRRRPKQHDDQQKEKERVETIQAERSH